MALEVAALDEFGEHILFERGHRAGIKPQLFAKGRDEALGQHHIPHAGGIATPADAALMMQLGAEGVFVGSGIFKSGNPAKRAAAIVKAVTNFRDADLLAELSEDLGEAMVGINEQEIQLLMAERGR